MSDNQWSRDTQGGEGGIGVCILSGYFAESPSRDYGCIRGTTVIFSKTLVTRICRLITHSLCSPYRLEPHSH